MMRWLACGALLISTALLCGAAGAQEVVLYAAAGVKAPAEELAKEFEQQTGYRAVRIYDTAGAAEQRFVAAGKAGVLITTSTRIRQSPDLVGGVTAQVGETLAGVAVAKGVARTGIGTPEGLKQALLSARTIAFSDPARGATVGAHFLQVIAQLGISTQVLAKSVKARDGIDTMKRVMAGEVDLGITQVSEIVQTDASTLLGPFPAELELATRYDFWYAAEADPAVKTLAETFVTAQGRAALLRHGLRPSP